MFYIFGKETKVVNDISGYHADNPNAVVHVGDACVQPHFFAVLCPVLMASVGPGAASHDTGFAQASMSVLLGGLLQR